MGKKEGTGEEWTKGGILKYEGGWLQDQKHGFGIKYRDNGKGKVYEGDWQCDKREGNGKEYGPTSELLFEGVWTGDRRLTGKLFYKNGVVTYEGGFNYEGRKEGKGIKYDFSGNVQLEGDWANDVMEGRGTEFFASKQIKYVGTWSNNLKSGKGVSYYDNGTLRYKGTWLKDKFDGKGTLYSETGSILYTGSFSKDLYDGNGTVYDKFGQMQYEGGWLEGVKNGYGIEFDKYSHNKTFEGHFQEGKRHGIGTELWGNGGIKYKGEWEKDVKSGKGIEYDWHGEKVFEGKFHKGERKVRTILFNFMPGQSPQIRSMKEVKYDTTLGLKKDMQVVEVGQNSAKNNNMDITGPFAHNMSSERVARGKSSDLKKFSPANDLIVNNGGKTEPPKKIKKKAIEASKYKPKVPEVDPIFSIEDKHSSPLSVKLENKRKSFLGNNKGPFYEKMILD